MIRIVSAAVLALVVGACATRPPTYDYAIFIPMPAQPRGPHGTGAVR